MSGRLPSGLEASSLLRRAQAAGDFATILKSGDADRGALLLVIASRGRHIACLERRAAIDGSDQWHVAGPGESAGSDEVSEFLARRARFDEDSWVIELDVAQPERFIAETTSGG